MFTLTQFSAKDSMSIVRSALTTLCLISIFQVTTTAAEDLKIGTTLTLTGAYSTYGQQALHGIELAIEEANAKGGVGGRKVKLLVEDTGTYDLKLAVTAARKLITVDKVEVFLPMIVEDSEVVVPLTSKVPLLSMVVGCGARKCGSNLGKYNVRAPSSHDQIVERLVAHTQQSDVKHSCIIAAEATYFEGYGRYIEELLKKAGQKVTYEAVPLSATDDYREIATRFKRDNCDAIFSWISIGSSGAFFKRIRESGSKALILGVVESDDPSILSVAGPAAEGVVFARFSIGTKEFQERFKKRFGVEVSRPAIPSYDGVKLLLELIDKVGSTPDALRAEIVKTKNRPAENGVMTYTEEGERVGEEVQLMRIVGGVPVEVK